MFRIFPPMDGTPPKAVEYLRFRISSKEMGMNPSKLGYRMPAEWEPHEATWLVWPSNQETWPGAVLARVQETCLQMIEALLPGERVKLLVRDESERESVLKKIAGRIQHAERIDFFQAACADLWIRDFGPTFLRDAQGKKAWCKWKFNAWGGKYESHLADHEVFLQKITPDEKRFDADFILEGGAIEVNGQGLCLTTEQCLLGANRNPHLSREAIEKKLRDYLGVGEIFWLGRGIAGDDTDGHIDDLARFTDSQTIVACVEKNDQDENALNLQENWRRLKEYSKQHGYFLNIIRLPMPEPIFSSSGNRLPASYANFYIGSEVLLLPVFQVRQDHFAKQLFTELFPNRRVISIDCRDLVSGFGALHCATQQEPEGVL